MLFTIAIATAGSLSGAYILYISALYLAQGRIIFFPSPPDFLNYRKLARFSVDLCTKDGTKLQGWSAPTNVPSVKHDQHLIYFGGNAQEASAMIPLLQELNLGLVSTFNYRGYGLSEGAPSEITLYQDALEIYDSISKKHPNSNIIVMGHSLGSAVAGHVARHRNPEKLILSSPLHSIEKIAAERFYAPSFAIKHRFSLQQSAKHIESKVLALVAKGDSVIPNHHSYETLQNIPQLISAEELTGVDHNSLLYSPTAKIIINNFIAPD